MVCTLLCNWYRYYNIKKKKKELKVSRQYSHSMADTIYIQNNEIDITKALTDYIT